MILPLMVADERHLKWRKRRIRNDACHPSLLELEKVVILPLRLRETLPALRIHSSCAASRDNRVVLAWKSTLHSMRLFRRRLVMEQDTSGRKADLSLLETAPDQQHWAFLLVGREVVLVMELRRAQTMAETKLVLAREKWTTITLVKMNRISGGDRALLFTISNRTYQQQQRQRQSNVPPVQVICLRRPFDDHQERFDRLHRQQKKLPMSKQQRSNRL